jgi:putative transposase
MTTVLAMVRNHSVSTLVVHAVWATADRASVLPYSADEWLAQELRRNATELGAVMLAVGNAADHVHVVVQHSPRMALATLIGRLKGASSRAAHVAGVLGCEEGWQVGYWVESVAAAHLEPLLDYVTHQRAHHAIESTLEPWQHLVQEPASGGLRAPLS